MSARDRLFQIEVLEFGKRRGNYSAGADNGMGRKDVDHWTTAPHRTLLKRAKSAEIAKNWAKRFGSILHCEKVDTSPYYRNIEFLNLEEKPIEIRLDREEFIVNKALELTRQPQRTPQYSVEVVDKQPEP